MKVLLRRENIFVILIILLLGISASVLAEGNNPAANPGENKSPGYQITRPAAVIKVNPLDNFNSEQNQKNMKISWHKKNQASDQDLEFTLDNDLILTRDNKSKNNIAHGFVSRNNKSSNKIPAAKILISINGSEYLKFNQGIKILDKTASSAELEFKIDEKWLKKNWRAIPAGVYKGDIDVNLDRPGNKPRLQVIIQTAAVINLPENRQINLTVDDPTTNKSSNSLSWEVNSNEDSYQIEFKSEGIQAVKDEKQEKRFVKHKKEDSSINYKSYFEYSLDDNPDHSFAPGETKIVSITKGELSLNYSPGDYEEGRNRWYDLLAGKYQDQVTVTISGE